MNTIYLDMDGVVADWNARVDPILGRHQQGFEPYTQEDWTKVLAHPRLFKELPLCANAELLVSASRAIAQQHKWDLKFLTAVPHQNDFPWAFWDKIAWADQYFPGIPVWFGPYSNDKWKHCQPFDILIDDRPSNIEEWRGAGGQAIYHTGDVLATLVLLESCF